MVVMSSGTCSSYSPSIPSSFSEPGCSYTDESEVTDVAIPSIFDKLRSCLSLDLTRKRKIILPHGESAEPMVGGPQTVNQ